MVVFRLEACADSLGPNGGGRDGRQRLHVRAHRGETWVSADAACVEAAAAGLAAAALARAVAAGSGCLLR